MGLIIKTVELSGAFSGDPADAGHAMARESCMAVARELPPPGLAKFAAGIISGGVGALAAVMGNNGAADLLESAAKALRELPPPAAERH
jgi:hypothetical protein